MEEGYILKPSGFSKIVDLAMSCIQGIIDVGKSSF